MFTYKKSGFNTLNDMFDSMLDKQAQGDHKGFAKMSSLLTFNDKMAFIDYSKGHKVFAGAMKDMLSECCGKFSVSQNYANLIMNALTLAGYYTEVKDSLDGNYPQFDFSDNMLIEGTVHLFDHKVCLKAVDATGKLYEKSITFYTDKDLVESVNHFQKDIQETFNKKEDVSMDALLQNPEFMASIGAEDCLVQKKADMREATQALSEFLNIEPSKIKSQDGKKFTVDNDTKEYMVSDTKQDLIESGYKEKEHKLDNNNTKFIYTKDTMKKEQSQVITFYKKAEKEFNTEEFNKLAEEILSTKSENIDDMWAEENACDLSNFEIFIEINKDGNSSVHKIKGDLEFIQDGWNEPSGDGWNEERLLGHYEIFKLDSIFITEIDGKKGEKEVPLNSEIGKFIIQITEDDEDFYRRYNTEASIKKSLSKTASIEELKTAIDKGDLKDIKSLGNEVTGKIDGKSVIKYTLERYANDQENGIMIVKKLYDLGASLEQDDIITAKDLSYDENHINTLNDIINNMSEFDKGFQEGFNAFN